MSAAPAGYSGTPLPKRLGIKPGTRIAPVSAPADFEDTLGDLPEAVTLSNRLRGKVDVFVFFPRNAADLARRLPTLAARLDPAGGLWVAWPKKSSGVATDLDFSVVQAAGLAAGLVDNKVCAISEIHSGLRFVYRLSDR
ncbi:MAG: DUF3052 domain-containing protein [Thermoanaerobaculia bacterium]